MRAFIVPVRGYTLFLISLLFIVDHKVIKYDEKKSAKNLYRLRYGHRSTVTGVLLQKNNVPKVVLGDLKAAFLFRKTES